MTSAPWPDRPLGQLVDVLDHKRVPVSAKERASRVGDVPYYGAAGQVGWIDKPLFDEPLLLLGEDGVQFFDPAKSKAYLVDGPAWVNNHAHVLRARGDQVLRRFLLYYLNWADYRGFANGTTRLKLTKSAMTSIPIPLPDLREQRRMVEILDDHLSRLQAASALVSTAVRRCAALQRACLSEWLGCPPAEQMFTVGQRLESARGGWSRGRQHEVVSEGVEYLKMNNITRSGQFDLAQVVRVAGTHDEIERFSLRAGDVLFNSKNSGDLVGKTAVASVDVEGWTFNENIMRLRFDATVIPQFAGMWFQGPLLRQAIRSSVKASTNVAAIYMNQLRTMPFWVPPIVDQKQLVDNFDEMRAGSDRLQEQLNSASRRQALLRRAVLQAAFSGQLT